MVYTALAGLLIILAFFVVLVAGRLLFKGPWFLGWLKGMSGIVLAGFAVILSLAALDFYSYKQINREEFIANLSFSRISPQHFQVSLVDSNGLELVRELKGDLWQLDARIMKWNKTLAGLGLSTGYRLDRLSGRYYSLEKEQAEQRTIYELRQNNSSLDMWAWLRKYGQYLNIIDASYGNATYLPMADGALFSVTLSNTGLLTRPLNSRAKAAVDGWQ
ncbi:MAG: cation/multidrug efflux pump [Spongiibacteraceae bacterium]|nr:cation/multidrug efflux pump [Spongiibacteraceae bacterium]